MQTTPLSKQGLEPESELGARGQSHHGEDPHTTLIKPQSGWEWLNFMEIWRFRELLLFVTWRDVKIRYKQTLLGALWAVLQPFMMMIVFTIFFGRMAKVSSGDIPYPIFVYAGLLPWTFFSTAITTAGNSVVGAQSIITNVYFPRLIVPFASVGAAIVDFGIAFTMLIGLMFYYGIVPGWSMLLVPILLGLTALAALGAGTMLATLNVSYRDFKYVIPFLVQLWLFATPSVYMNVSETAETQPADAQAQLAEEAAGQEAQAEKDAADAKSSPWVKALINVNPMNGVIAFFRAATLGGPLPWSSLGVSAAMIWLLFMVAIFYFRRLEMTFADII